MIHRSLLHALTARLLTERPALQPAQARAIAAAVGDSPFEVGDEILTTLDGAPYRFPAAWFEEAAGSAAEPPLFL